jgi:uncharacterized protein
MHRAIAAKCDRGAAVRRMPRVPDIAAPGYRTAATGNTRGLESLAGGRLHYGRRPRYPNPFRKQVLMPALMISPYVLPIVLLIGSNAFMTTAWYWHLRFKEVPLWQVILISWGLAFFEYCMAVPANRYGSNVYSAAQLKTIQEVITLTVFGVFSVVYLQQAVTWNQIVGFALIAAGAFFVFRAPL